MRELYQENILKTEQEVARLQKTINNNSLLRLVLIVGGGATLFQVFQMNSIMLVFAAFFSIILTFAYLVRRQGLLEKVLAEKLAFLQVNTNEVRILDGKANMYADGAVYNEGKHPYVSDLDIFGPKSLFASINRAATPDGVAVSASWFLSPATKKEILARQDAARELTEKLEWTQRLQTKLLFNLGQQTHIKTFLTRYLGDQALAFGSAFMRLYVPLAPFLMLAGLVFSVIVFPLWNYLLLLAIVHLLWTLALGGKVSFFSSKIDKIGTTLIAYADAVEMLEKEPFSASLNKTLQEDLKTEKNEQLSQAFKNLGRLVDKLDTRNNVLVGALLNMVFLWDFKQVMAIIKWKSSYEGDVVKTFDIMAQYEALLTLATLKRNSPEWSEPVLLDCPLRDRIVATEINHPLIPHKNAVSNTYTAQQHRIALVTGSNMAGKSTFLRTIGINAVLAYAGAVVCAQHFELPIYKLVSYMRIKDNLNESTSTFKAELDRMKFILDIVSNNQDAFVLIDEMLRGTNSVDKYLGSRAIIKKLIQMDGKGLVATHDLQLSSLEEEYPGVLKNYHFDIQVQKGEMLFDYKLKEGKCTVFNAAMLLKGIGVDVDKAESEHENKKQI